MFLFDYLSMIISLNLLAPWMYWIRFFSIYYYANIILLGFWDQLAHLHLSLLFDSSLSVIFLNNNLITELDNSTFFGAQNLYYIDVSYNKISKISPGTFSDQLNLEYIYLDHNLLTELDNNTFLRTTYIYSVNFLLIHFYTIYI